ncbi:MAG TPA: AAA family ATPase [Nocardioides sp.]|nr:AAA family ATPase [Nocardioides sp.]
MTTRPHAGATNETTPAVRAEGLVKTFGEQRAVDHVDLEVRRGQVFGVLGPNGDGRAAIFGHDVRREPHVARQLLGSPGSTRRTTRNLTATENLMIFARLQGVAKPISAHSGGMRRCLDLAASLITRPPLILLDEPTTGLDPRARGRMWDTIRDLVANGCTVLLTTQYLDEARDTCTWSAFGARRVVGPDLRQEPVVGQPGRVQREGRQQVGRPRPRDRHFVDGDLGEESQCGRHRPAATER